MSNHEKIMLLIGAVELSKFYYCINSSCIMEGRYLFTYSSPTELYLISSRYRPEPDYFLKNLVDWISVARGWKIPNLKPYAGDVNRKGRGEKKDQAAYHPSLFRNVKNKGGRGRSI